MEIIRVPSTTVPNYLLLSPFFCFTNNNASLTMIKTDELTREKYLLTMGVQQNYLKIKAAHCNDPHCLNTVSHECASRAVGLEDELLRNVSNNTNETRRLCTQYNDAYLSGHIKYNDNVGYIQLATSMVHTWLSRGNLERSIMQENVSFNLEQITNSITEYKITLLSF